MSACLFCTYRPIGYWENATITVDGKGYKLTYPPPTNCPHVEFPRFDEDAKLDS